MISQVYNQLALLNATGCDLTMQADCKPCIPNLQSADISVVILNNSMYVRQLVPTTVRGGGV